MSFEKRLDAVEGKLNVTMSPQQEAHYKELWRRIEEGRKRAGLPPRDPHGYVDHGGSLADRLKAARERREAKEDINRTVQG